MSELTREEWIEALRSGEYEQGKQWLCNKNEEYCCLGVAGKEMGLLKIDLAKAELLSDIQNLEDLDFITEHEEDFLACLNDMFDFTFEEIADVLESDFDWEVIEEIYKNNHQNEGGAWDGSFLKDKFNERIKKINLMKE